jgi:uridine phosphorylase
MKTQADPASHPFPPDDLILRPDGSVYHLGLHPDELADHVITVGDPERVDRISRYFDRIQVKKQQREFRTHTGEIGGKRITVISTGMGSGNVDIVLNELDALKNIDLVNRVPLKDFRALNLIRLGTAGGLQDDLLPGSMVVTDLAIGLDNLLSFYGGTEAIEKVEVKTRLMEDLELPVVPYVVQADRSWRQWAITLGCRAGMTVTNAGFYGPQGRALRLRPSYPDLLDRLSKFTYNQKRVLNLEMETAAILALSSMLGHRACSLSVILANRPLGQFSDHPEKDIDHFIEVVMTNLIDEPWPN